MLNQVGVWLRTSIITEDLMSLEVSVRPHDLVFGRLLLIYQMPKVGSQTIEATLRQSLFADPIYRFHYLSNAFAKTLKRGLASRQPDQVWKRDAQMQLDSIRIMSRAIRWRRILCFCRFNIPKL